MHNTENIGGVYTLTNPYADLHPIYVSGSTRCKDRYKTPLKAAKQKKRSKAKKRMSKQSRKHNR